MKIGIFLAAFCLATAFAQEISDTIPTEEPVVPEVAPEVAPQVAPPEVAPASASEPAAKEDAVAQAAQDFREMLKMQAAKEDVAPQSGGLSKLHWLGIATYTLAVGFAGAAAVKQFSKVDKYKDNIKDLEKQKNKGSTKSNYKQWRDSYVENVENVNKYEKQRNLYLIGAGGLLFAGTLTFLF